MYRFNKRIRFSPRVGDVGPRPSRPAGVSGFNYSSDLDDVVMAVVGNHDICASVPAEPPQVAKPVLGDGVVTRSASKDNVRVLIGRGQAIVVDGVTNDLVLESRLEEDTIFGVTLDGVVGKLTLIDAAQECNAGETVVDNVIPDHFRISYGGADQQETMSRITGDEAVVDHYVDDVQRVIRLEIDTGCG